MPRLHPPGVAFSVDQLRYGTKHITSDKEGSGNREVGGKKKGRTQITKRPQCHGRKCGPQVRSEAEPLKGLNRGHDSMRWQSEKIIWRECPSRTGTLPHLEASCRAPIAIAFIQKENRETPFLGQRSKATIMYEAKNI